MIGMTRFSTHAARAAGACTIAAATALGAGTSIVRAQAPELPAAAVGVCAIGTDGHPVAEGAATADMSGLAHLTAHGSAASTATRPPRPTAQSLPTIEFLTEQARARTETPARVTLGDASNLPGLDTPQRLGTPTLPNYLRAMTAVPQAAAPLAAMTHAVLYEGALSTETKAAMALRMAQVNRSPYVAAHAMHALRASERGQSMLHALSTETLDTLTPADRLAVGYAESLTRDVHGVSDEDFARVRGAFNDSEIVELTITTAFYNYFTRLAEALRLPVEPWALGSAGPAPWRGSAAESRARVALLQDEEISAAAAVMASSKDTRTAPGGLGLGMANSQRAMLRAPAQGLAWRAYGAAVREKETVGRDIKLQVSFAVSWQNQCRYCTLHQVLGLRRLGVDIGKLVAMQKDDASLTPREAVAVRFARTLTTKPGGVTDADYAALTKEFGEVGAFEVLLQACQFAFMNRFTDGLRLPSEDEAVRVYQETYGGGWKGTK